MPADCAAPIAPVTLADEPFLIGEPHAPRRPAAGWSTAVAHLTPRTGQVLLPPAAHLDGDIRLADLEARLQRAAAEWAKVVDEDQDGWDECNQAHSAVIEELAAFQPATAAELARKLSILLSPAAEGALDDLDKGTFDGGLLDNIMRLASAVQSPSPDDEARARWITAHRRWSEAHAQALKAQAERRRLDAEAKAKSPPVPASIQIPEVRVPAAYSPGMLADGAPPAERLKKDMPSALLALMREEAAAYQAECQRVQEKVGACRAEALEDAAWEVVGDLRDELLRTPAADLAGAVCKLNIIQDLQDGESFEDPNLLARLDSDPSSDMWGQVELYRDLCRLGGIESQGLKFERFDAAAFVARWLSAGARADARWGLSHLGAGSRADFLVSEPEAIAAYHRYVRETFYAGREDERAPKDERAPFVLPQREAIAWSYPHDPDRVAELEALWDRRVAEARQLDEEKKALQPWQREAVQYECACRAEAQG